MTPQQRATNAETYRKLAGLHDKNARQMIRMALDEFGKVKYWEAQAEQTEATDDNE
jgi:hypothetical protein